ncbi:exopolyphosphatase / guanosine-5'-triphosphate,3'-diphosphate pyrophosphatase [Acidocella aminolytica 101 = DSM 11237]|nr:exopolyphosphatase / guanosine-5'-triphosphate,3'-diphosphate pyrophosphatase [Acidocella aminolytica 101 = DSM 11237]
MPVIGSYSFWFLPSRANPRIYKQMVSQFSLVQPTQPVSNRRGRRRAVFGGIDLGTNNCRMLVGTPAAHGFQILDSFSRVVRLGEGLYETGKLSALAMDRAISSLAICADRARRWTGDEFTGPIRLRAIATEACRQAENGVEFVHRAREATGLPLEIINPREEAELAVESCAPLLRKAGRRALLFDIGGGSTEIAWVRLDSGIRPELIGYLSLPVGVVTLSERCAGACYQSEGFFSLVEDIITMLRPFESVHRIGEEIRRGGVVMVGTSGTVTTLAGVSLKLDRYRRGLVDGVSLTRRAVDDALAEACALGRDGLSRHPCIGMDRVEFVLPGCAIFAAIHELWQAPRLMVADRGLREGMLMRLMRDMPTHKHRYNA